MNLLFKLVVAFAFIATLAPSTANACKCGLNEDAWSDSVVIRGVALEWMMGDWGSRKSTEYHQARYDTATATRYLVERSNRLKPGVEAIVFGRYPEGGNCGTAQVAVGHRGVIVAREQGGVLVTTRCSNLVGNTESKILRKLGLSESWDSIRHSEPVVDGDEACAYSESLDDAIVSQLGLSDRSWFGQGDRGWFGQSDPVRFGQADRGPLDE